MRARRAPCAPNCALLRPISTSYFRAPTFTCSCAPAERATARPLKPVHQSRRASRMCPAFLNRLLFAHRFAPLCSPSTYYRFPPSTPPKQAPSAVPILRSVPLRIIRLVRTDWRLTAAGVVGRHVPRQPYLSNTTLRPVKSHHRVGRRVFLRPVRSAQCIRRRLHLLPAIGASHLRVVAGSRGRRPMVSPRGTARSALLQHGIRAASGTFLGTWKY